MSDTRKIEISQKGRVYWKPGQEHPLDVLYEEEDKVKGQLPGLLEELLSTAQQTTIRLNGVLEAARESDDLALLFSEADRAAHHLIVDRFHNRKHYSHLHAAFSLQRYKRLMGRLRTIQAALTLANDLLGAEETLSQEFLATWRQSRQQEEGQETEEMIPQDALTDEPLQLETEEKSEELSDEPQPQQSGTEGQQAVQPPPTKEELRVQGLDQPLTGIVSSVNQSRELLRTFEARLPDLRRQLATGQGWFEIFHVSKRRYKSEVIAYAKALKRERKRKVPIPAEIANAIHPEVAQLIQAGVERFPTELREEVYDITKVGPYVKYRWLEGGRTYTISLGLIDDYPPYPFVPEGF